jgi:copper chaperone CopZ
MHLFLVLLCAIAVYATATQTNNGVACTCYNDLCFCDGEASKINSCIEMLYPNYPFVNDEATETVELDINEVTDCQLSTGAVEQGGDGEEETLTPTANGIVCACDGSSFSYSNLCFCDDEAFKINSCIEKLYPNYPFVYDKDKNSCGTPIDNDGFSDCIDKATETVNLERDDVTDCQKLTGAVEEGGEAVNELATCYGGYCYCGLAGIAMRDCVEEASPNFPYLSETSTEIDPLGDFYVLSCKKELSASTCSPYPQDSSASSTMSAGFAVGAACAMCVGQMMGWGGPRRRDARSSKKNVLKGIDEIEE